MAPGHVLESFGPRTGWLAVRDCPPVRVAEVLGLRTSGNADPAAAIAAMYEDGRSSVVVLPALEGAGGSWTLAAGMPLLAPSPVAITEWSRRLDTTVQGFASDHIVERHRWIVAERGHVVRALEVLGESGELVLWQGRPTPAELALGLPDLDALTDADEAFEVVLAVDEDAVMAVAGAWSVDPSTLEGVAVGGPALIGRASGVQQP